MTKPMRAIGRICDPEIYFADMAPLAVCDQDQKHDPLCLMCFTSRNSKYSAVNLNLSICPGHPSPYDTVFATSKATCFAQKSHALPTRCVH